MSGRTATATSISACWADLSRFRQALAAADAVVIGAGAGLSTAAGFTYDGARFARYFGDFISRYGLRDKYTGGNYPYATPQEYWPYSSRYIAINRYQDPPRPVYADLLQLVQDRDYFVLTTNVDHCFQKAGFDKRRLFYTQGDYGLWQCSVPCHARTYDNETAVRQMLCRQRDGKIPRELVPHCPVCGAPMAMNLRADASFVQDSGWYAAAGRYQAFLRGHEGRRVLFWELGVGNNTPAIIKYSFWRLALQNPRAVYASMNLAPPACPQELAPRAICLTGDIGALLRALRA